MKKTLLYLSCLLYSIGILHAQDTLFNKNEQSFEGIYNKLTYSEGNKLKKLRLENVGQFNDSIALLVNLEEFVNQGNDLDFSLKKIPNGLYSCYKLKTLRLIYNQDPLFIDNKIAQLQSLENLELYVQNIPKGLYLLDNLKELTLSISNKDSLIGIPNLIRLSISSRSFVTNQGAFFKEIENFKNLKYLRTEIFDGINNFKTIKELQVTISGGKEQFASQIGNLTQLETLYIRYDPNQRGIGKVDLSFLEKLVNLKKLVLISLPINYNEPWFDKLTVEHFYSNNNSEDQNSILKNKNIQHIYLDPSWLKEDQDYSNKKIHITDYSMGSDAAKIFRKFSTNPTIEFYLENGQFNFDHFKDIVDLKNVKVFSFENSFIYNYNKKELIRFLQNNNFDKIICPTIDPEHLKTLVKNCKSVKEIIIPYSTTEYLTSKDYDELKKALKNYKNKTIITLVGPDLAIKHSYFDGL